MFIGIILIVVYQDGLHFLISSRGRSRHIRDEREINLSVHL